MKILVILILVVAAVLLALGPGFAFAQPRPKKPEDARTEGQNHERSSFESWLAGLKITAGNSASLTKSTFQAGSPNEIVGKADGIRTVKFRLITPAPCEIEIHYIDNAPHDDTLGDQKVHLLRAKEGEGKGGDRRETTIVLLKSGGQISFGPCSVHKTGPCPGRIQVEK